jgi:hypothetical protein
MARRGRVQFARHGRQRPKRSLRRLPGSGVAEQLRRLPRDEWPGQQQGQCRHSGEESCGHEEGT